MERKEMVKNVRSKPLQG